MSFISKDSFWFEDENSEMVAMCTKCHKVHNKGWFWKSEAGYGDYDLKCYYCKEVLHQRNDSYKEEDEIKTGI